MIKIENSRDHPLVEEVVREGQEHVFRWWDDLSGSQQDSLLNQLRDIDFTLLKELRKRCVESSHQNAIREVLEPVEVVPIPWSMEQRRAAEAAEEVGEEWIRCGKVAVFLVAGGQGTRLGFDGPKGMFPIGPVTGKSLFQLHAEKILAASRDYGVAIPWYLMTSETTDEETKKFFQRHRFFGLDEEDVFFLKQRMIPALDEKGRLILDRKDHIFTSPNGHGGSLLALMESGAFGDMKRRGVEVLSYFQVDNVLINLMDPVFIGYHVRAGAEMSSKMVRKRDPGEKVGIFGRAGGILKVIEYSDMSKADMEARNPDGSLKYDAGSIAIHLMNADFVDDEVRGGFKLPYHVAHKKIPYLDENGERIFPERPNGYKFETFIFDALGHTIRSVIMEIVREEEFSPVKNREGEDSPETARRDLTNLFSGWLESAGVSVPRKEDGNVDGLIEISPLFARNKESFLKNAPKNLSLKGSLYIGPE